MRTRPRCARRALLSHGYWTSRPSQVWPSISMPCTAKSNSRGRNRDHARRRFGARPASARSRPTAAAARATRPTTSAAACARASASARGIRRDPSTCVPPATARIAPKPCASSFSVQTRLPAFDARFQRARRSTRRSTRCRRHARSTICSPATSYSLRLTIVHSAWPAPGKRLANTPACSVFSYGVQSALTMSGANCRWIVAIRRSVSASRGVS